QTLLTRAEQILDGTRRLEELARDLRAGRIGTVTVGCVARHVTGFLGAALGTFHHRHPEVRVVIDEVELDGQVGIADLFGEALRSGAVDVVFGPRLPGTRAIAAYDSTIVCAVPPRHPWRTHEAVEIDSLRDLPLLVAPHGYYSRGALERACRAWGF